MPKSTFSPSIGTGLNYTVFFIEDHGKDPAATRDKDEDGFGYALHAGSYYQRDDRQSLNFDAKKLFLEKCALDNKRAINAKDVDFVPLILGRGVGYHF